MKKLIIIIVIILGALPLVNAQNDLGNNYLLDDNRLEVFPVPAKQGDLLFINCCFDEDDWINIRIYDMLGRRVYDYTKEKANFDQIAINTKNIPASKYFLQLRVNDEIRTTKIIITE